MLITNCMQFIEQISTWVVFSSICNLKNLSFENNVDLDRLASPESPFFIMIGHI